jgi:hypothetical protein
MVRRTGIQTSREHIRPLGQSSDARSGRRNEPTLNHGAQDFSVEEGLGPC